MGTFTQEEYLAVCANQAKQHGNVAPALASARPSRAALARREPVSKLAPRRTGHEGKGFESLIESSGTAGVVVTHFGQQAKRYRDRATGKLVTIAIKGPVDFGLTLWGGRAGWLDAKEDKNPNRLKTSKDHLHAHQRDALVAHGRGGAVAGLLCHASATGRVLWCNWTRLVTARPSILWAEMVDVGPSTHAVNWYAVVRAAENATAHNPVPGFVAPAATSEAPGREGGR